MAAIHSFPYRASWALTLLLGFIGFVATAQAITAEEKCQMKRAKEKGKYEKCVQNWLAKCYGKNDCDQEKLSKCRVKYQNKWPKLQKLSNTSCSAPRFEDNGLSITDNLTGLVWEKKTGTVGVISPCPGGASCGDANNVNNYYDWSVDGFDRDENGTVFTDFLATLNNLAYDGSSGWRIPTFAELQTILIPHPYPCAVGTCIDPIFGPTRTTFSGYWSSTTYAPGFASAWYVIFTSGAVDWDDTTDNQPVRAVRGGF